MVTLSDFLLLICRKIQIMTEQEFENIYCSLRLKLIALAGRFSQAASVDMDGEDIVHEALQALWELSERGYPIRNVEALLVKITKNICVAHYRKQKFPSVQLGNNDFVSGDSAAGRIVDADIVQIKRLMYESLTATERCYMELKADKDMSLDEIAKATGKTKPGIKTSLSKAKAKMYYRLKKLGVI